MWWTWTLVSLMFCGVFLCCFFVFVFWRVGGWGVSRKMILTWNNLKRFPRLRFYNVKGNRYIFVNAFVVVVIVAIRYSYDINVTWIDGWRHSIFIVVTRYFWKGLSIFNGFIHKQHKERNLNWSYTSLRLILLVVNTTRNKAILSYLILS